MVQTIRRPEETSPIARCSVTSMASDDSKKSYKD